MIGLYIKTIYLLGIFLATCFIVSQFYLAWMSVVGGEVREYLIETICEYESDLHLVPFAGSFLVNIIILTATAVVVILASPLLFPFVIFFLSAKVVRMVIERGENDV